MEDKLDAVQKYIDGHLGNHDDIVHFFQKFMTEHVRPIEDS